MGIWLKFRGLITGLSEMGYKLLYAPPSEVYGEIWLVKKPCLSGDTESPYLINGELPDSMYSDYGKINFTDWGIWVDAFF